MRSAVRDLYKRFLLVIQYGKGPPDMFKPGFRDTLKERFKAQDDVEKGLAFGESILRQIEEMQNLHWYRTLRRKYIVPAEDAAKMAQGRQGGKGGEES